jgi:hypothetical protein
VLVGIVAIVAFALRLHMEVHGGGLLGINAYDDGVHLSSAAAMVHGRAPYRDFLFLQAPGMLLAASPFALLAEWLGDPAALIAFRVAFELVGAANAVLVVVVLRRFGVAAAVTGGLFYAVFAPAVYDERTALLEPLGTLAVLGSLALLPRALRPDRRVFFLVGALLGVACDFKIWYLVAAAVIVAFSRGGRLPVLLGVLTSGAAVYLPFFVLAPQRMFSEVVIDQLGRPRNAGATPAIRLESLLGVSGIHSRSPVAGASPSITLAVFAAIAAASVVLALRDRRARVFVAVAAADLLVALVAPSYFPHYAGLTAPLFALILGVAAGRVAGRVGSPRAQIAVVAAAVIAVTALNAGHDLARVDVRPPGEALRTAATRIRGCIVADDPTILLVMNVLTRDLDHGCPLRPDVSGYSYGPDAGRVPEARPANTVYQADTVRYLQSGSAFIRVRKDTQLDSASNAELSRDPIRFRSGDYVIREVK